MINMHGVSPYGHAFIIVVMYLHCNKGACMLKNLLGSKKRIQYARSYVAKSYAYAAFISALKFHHHNYSYSYV